MPLQPHHYTGAPIVLAEWLTLGPFNVSIEENALVENSLVKVFPSIPLPDEGNVSIQSLASKGVTLPKDIVIVPVT